MMIPPVTAAAGAADPGRARAEATAREFEAVFIGQMAKLMLESVETPGEFGGGHGEEMFRGVLAEQLGGAIQQKGGLGLAPAVLDQIIRLQEAAKK
jgi:Rod binding domain-containing protein